MNTNSSHSKKTKTKQSIDQRCPLTKNDTKKDEPCNDCLYPSLMQNISLPNSPEISRMLVTVTDRIRKLRLQIFITSLCRFKPLRRQLGLTFLQSQIHSSSNVRGSRNCFHESSTVVWLILRSFPNQHAISFTRIPKSLREQNTREACPM